MKFPWILNMVSHYLLAFIVVLKSNSIIKFNLVLKVKFSFLDTFKIFSVL